jgi:hypothetical protein
LTFLQCFFKGDLPAIKGRTEHRSERPGIPHTGYIRASGYTTGNNYRDSDRIDQLSDRFEPDSLLQSFHVHVGVE